ncbi:MAG: hypothetical protein HKN74_08780 [Acidimicrobiia bacterium]|nr:hypothetical protein [Acidimicrobiia bacterium]MBT8216291.1 hypothetical protein [Acidimicrobiia bacterium]NNF10362.1 hypothetical protein [Acidimicrobiia bacterium]NNL71524.1 hypothetical protein [Acidimicrobiia bacterium]
MNIRTLLGLTALLIGVLTATAMPSLAGLALADARPDPVVLIDTGVVVDESRNVAVSAYSVSLPSD